MEYQESKIPSRSDIQSNIEKDISDSLYENYYRPYAKFLVEKEGIVGKREILLKAKKEVRDETKVGHLKDLFEYDPYLSLRVAGVQPRASTFVDLAVKKYGINISPSTINNVQGRCVELRKDMYEITLKYFTENAVSKVYERLNISEENLYIISKEKHRQILEEYGLFFAKELPSKLKSFNQSMVKIGGDANEIISIRALREDGLEEDTHFSDIASQEGSEGDPGDLRIFTTASADPINVEIKSEKSRERGGAGIARLDSPSVLFGYFDDETELLGNCEELLEGCIAVYAPPSTLKKMSFKRYGFDRYIHQSSSAGTSRGDDWLFFRDNTRFAEDMETYYQHGRLPRRAASTLQTSSTNSDGPWLLWQEAMFGTTDPMNVDLMAVTEFPETP